MIRCYVVLAAVCLSGCSRGPSYAEAVQTYQAEQTELERLQGEREKLLTLDISTRDKLLKLDIERAQNGLPTADGSSERREAAFQKIDEQLKALDKKIADQLKRVGEAERAKEAAR